MSHHQANLEPLSIFKFLLTVLFVSKAADPCVISEWSSVLVQLLLPAGVNKFPQYFVDAFNHKFATDMTKSV
jgi:hypothetical protein